MKTIVLLVLLSVSATALRAQGKSDLKMEEIMKGYDWVGNLPDQIQWLNQSDYFFFSWNPDNTPSAPQYSYNLRSKELSVTSDAVRDALPPRSLVYNNDRTRFLYVSSGDLYLQEVKSGRVTRLTNTLETINNPRFSRDEKAIIYQIGLNIFTRDIQTGFVTQLTDFRQGSASGSSQQQSAGGQFQQGGAAFRQGGQLQAGAGIASRQGGSLTDQDRWLRDQQLQLFDYFRVRQEQQSAQRGQARGGQTATQNRNERPRTINLDDGGASSIDICPNQRFVTYNTINRPSVSSKSTMVPNYITASGYVESFNARSKVGSPMSSVGLTIYDTDKRTVYSVNTSAIPGIRDVPEYMYDYGFEGKELNEDRAVNVGNVLWSEDGSYAVVNITSHDNKDRWIMLLDPETGDLKLLDRQRDEAWVGGPGISSRNMGFMPDNRRIWFQSEESGYSHLYTVDVVTGERTALTSGTFEVYSPSISLDKKWWYFSSNEVLPGERHFYRMPLNGGTRTQITSMEGSNEVSMSPDEKWLAIRYSYSNKPWEIYVMENKPGAQATKLTSSVTEEFSAYPWKDPQIVTFRAQDGEEVYARLYTPEEGVKNNAAVVFVHGAGYLQNVHKWWSQYFREYMFHNMLVDLGYTVLDIDYRGSSGYGRDWRTGIYRHMGGKDLSDHVDGAKYLVDNHGVDTKRIGIYGGSYGGFITLMAMFTEPGVFAAGAGLRSVTDWAHYNHGYTANILNTPVADSIAYQRSSPINFADGLEGALLMCHGIIDDNVQFQDIIRLSQRLIELGKENWELAVYPVERHSFTVASSWVDEYKRILKLFNENLLK
jgi:dipeptidyl aminopeptidase/acylaminoacyl peptidase